MNVETMDPVLKAKWVAALKSGNYIQHHGGWMDYNEKALCCVTVLFLEAGLEIRQKGPRECAAKLGIPDDRGTDSTIAPVGSLQYFIDMNDKHRFSFFEIAERIENPRPLNVAAVA